jgi:hypothetical protein
LLDTESSENVMPKDMSEDTDMLKDTDGSADTVGPLEVPSYKLEMTETTETSISGEAKLEDINQLRCGIDTMDGTKDGELSTLEENTSN